MEPESSEHVTEGKAPLVAHGFEYTNRPVRDVVWTVFFAILVLLVCGFGIYAGAGMNDDASQLLKQDYHTDPSYCSDSKLNEESGLETLNQESGEPSTPPNDNWFLQFLDEGWIWIVASTLGAVVVGFVFVLLFSYLAAVMVYTVAALFILVPLGAGIFGLVAYDDARAWAFVCFAVVIAIPIFCLHSQLRLTAKLLDLGADGLRDNLDLVFFSVCANIILLALMTGMIGFGVLALTNGKFELNGRVDQDSLPQCVAAGFVESQVDCCNWSTDNWVKGYWVLLVVMMIWTAFFIDQVKVYVVSGVISQWYFAEEDKRGDMSIFTSLKFALGPSFGSLVLSSLILTISNLVRRISEYLTKQAQEENSRCKWFITCIACMISGIAYIIEWITDFASVRMAITGESFFQAGKNVVNLMKENLLNAYAVWWFPPIVLLVLSLIISISVSTVLALTARHTWNDEKKFTDVQTWSWYIFIICFLLTIIVLRFFSTLLIDAVNAIFICFAIEKAAKTARNAKAHEVFELMMEMNKPSGIEGVQEVHTRAIVIETEPPAPANPPKV
eukprot:g8612.t1